MEGPSASRGRPFSCFWAKWYFAQMKQLLILASLLCTACSDRRPAAPTAAESAQLNDADAMLNQVEIGRAHV